MMPIVDMGTGEQRHYCVYLVSYLGVITLNGRCSPGSGNLIALSGAKQSRHVSSHIHAFESYSFPVHGEAQLPA